MYITQSAFARKINRSRQYINKLVKKGIIPTYENKKVRADEAKKIIEDLKDPRRDAQRDANATRRKSSDLFSVSGSYASVADMSEEEKAEELERKRIELQKLKDEAEALGVGDELPDDIAVLGIKELNAAILRQDLRIKTVKADEVEKNVVSVDFMERSIFEAARVVRDGLLNIPSRIAARVAAEQDSHKCRTMLEVEINRQLTNLAEIFNENKSNI